MPKETDVKHGLFSKDKKKYLILLHPLEIRPDTHEPVLRLTVHPSKEKNENANKN
jgi:hypothetical protein